MYYRKEWVKRQRIVHSYGDDDDDDCIEESELQDELHHRISNNTVPHKIPTTSDSIPDHVDFIVGGKRCKCGSSSHQRTSHRNCPLNKKSSAMPNPANTADKNTPHPSVGKKQCICGSSTHQRTSYSQCPLNTKNTPSES